MKATARELARILKARGCIAAKCDALDDVVGDAFTELFGHEIDTIFDAVLNMMEIPADDFNSETDTGFSRDAWHDEIFEIDEQQDPGGWSREHVELKDNDPYLIFVENSEDYGKE